MMSCVWDIDWIGCTMLHKMNQAVRLRRWHFSRAKKNTSKKACCNRSCFLQRRPQPQPCTASIEWMNGLIDWLMDGWMDGWIVGLNWLLASPSNCTAGWISAEPWYRCAPTTGFQRCQVPHRIHGTGIPTCTIKINQMQVHIPYTDPTVWVTVYYIFMRESLIRIFLNIFFVGSQDFPGCSCPIQAQKASSFLSW